MMDQSLREQIAEARVAVNAARSVLDQLISSCTHTFRPLTKDELSDKWMSEFAKCDICSRSFGWRCKVSPDCVCHYADELDGCELELINGNKVVVSAEEADTDCECCVFCGMPNERK